MTITIINYQHTLTMSTIININEMQGVPMSIELVNCPGNWTKSTIFDLFYAQNIGVVRHVEFITRFENTQSAYIDLDTWYTNDNTLTIIGGLMSGRKRSFVRFDMFILSPTYEFKNVPSRAKKFAQIKQKHMLAKQDTDDWNNLSSNINQLILNEQKTN